MNDSYIAAGCKGELFLWNRQSLERLALFDDTHAEDVVQVGMLSGKPSAWVIVFFLSRKIAALWGSVTFDLIHILFWETGGCQAMSKRISGKVVDVSQCIKKWNPANCCRPAQLTLSEYHCASFASVSMRSNGPSNLAPEQHQSKLVMQTF